MKLSFEKQLCGIYGVFIFIGTDNIVRFWFTLKINKETLIRARMSHRKGKDLFKTRSLLNVSSHKLHSCFGLSILVKQFPLSILPHTYRAVI